MKKKSLLFTCALALGILLTMTYIQPPVKILASTALQTTDGGIKDSNSKESNKQTADTYDYSITTFKKDYAVGKFIKVKGLSDTLKQKKINTILKADAKTIVNSYDISKSTTFFDMKVKGKYIKDTNLFIAIYTVEYNNLESAYPTNYYYVSVIDTVNASRVTYTDKKELANIKKAIKKGNFTCNTKDKEIAAAQKEYIKRLSEDELNNLLTNVNFKEKKGTVMIPDVFMYKTKNTVQMSIPAIHAIGDHIEISIKYSDIK